MFCIFTGVPALPDGILIKCCIEHMNEATNIVLLLHQNGPIYKFLKLQNVH